MTTNGSSRNFIQNDNSIQFEKLFVHQFINETLNRSGVSIFSILPHITKQERQQLFQHVGIWGGLLGSTMTLVALRRGPIWVTSWVLKQQKERTNKISSMVSSIRTTSNNKIKEDATIIGTANSAQKHVNNSPFVVPIVKQIKNVNRLQIAESISRMLHQETQMSHVGWWMIDIIASISVGISLSIMWAINQKGLWEDIAVLPLDERSMIAQTYCTSSIEVMNEIILIIKRRNKEHELMNNNGNNDQKSELHNDNTNDIESNFIVDDDDNSNIDNDDTATSILFSHKTPITVQAAACVDFEKYCHTRERMIRIGSQMKSLGHKDSIEYPENNNDQAGIE